MTKIWNEPVQVNLRVESVSRECLMALLPIWDKPSSKFLEKSIKFWDRFYSWKDEPPLVLKKGTEVVCVFFYTVTKKTKVYSVINIITPQIHRQKGYARILISLGWTDALMQKAKYIRLNCDEKALPFYDSLGMKYWGKTRSNDLFCFFPISKVGMKENFEYWDPEMISRNWSTPIFQPIMKEVLRRVITMSDLVPQKPTEDPLEF